MHLDALFAVNFICNNLGGLDIRKDIGNDSRI